MKSREREAFWLLFGGAFLIVDAWLSMQAMFGILDPRTFLQVMVACVMGLMFTAFAVGAEVMGIKQRLSGLLFWVAMFSFDLGTSILCVVWYGQMKQPMNSHIDLSRMHIRLENWMETSMYVGFVVFAAYCCIRLGQAIARVTEARATRGSATPSFEQQAMTSTEAAKSGTQHPAETVRHTSSPRSKQIPRPAADDEALAGLAAEVGGDLSDEFRQRLAARTSVERVVRADLPSVKGSEPMLDLQVDRTHVAGGDDASADSGLVGYDSQEEAGPSR